MQGTHECLHGNTKAMATVTAIIDGTGSMGEETLPFQTTAECSGVPQSIAMMQKLSNRHHGPHLCQPWELQYNDEIRHIVIVTVSINRTHHPPVTMAS